MGRELFTRAPHMQIVDYLRSVSAVGSVTGGYGPSGILRARNNLIIEAAIMIFGNHFNAWSITAHIADCKRSTIRSDGRISELVRTPVIRIRGRKKHMSNFTVRIIRNRDGVRWSISPGLEWAVDHDAGKNSQEYERRENRSRLAQRISHVSHLSSKQVLSHPSPYGQRLFTV